MQRLIESESLERFLGVMMPLMNESQRRHLLAAMSEMLGRGSIEELSNITGVSTVTISRGRSEIKEMELDPKARPPSKPNARIRAPGAGRKPAHEKQEGLDEVILSMLDGNIVGNPESPMTWTTLSTRRSPEG